MKLLMFFIFFLLLGGFFIISNEEIRLNNSRSFGEFSASYLNWLTGILDNAGSLTGYVVKMEWLPGEG
jgi:hypothetical protein